MHSNVQFPRIQLMFDRVCAQKNTTLAKVQRHEWGQSAHPRALRPLARPPRDSRSHQHCRPASQP